MPTGYTAKLMEHGQTFPEFVMTCARAFGALIEMRDEPLDAPIPEKFKPSTYSATRLKEAKAELARLSKMTARQQLAYGEKLRDENLKMWSSSEGKSEAENARIDAMVEQVKKWEPPTKDHRGLRDFMLDQLRISRHDLDWSRNYHNQQAKTPMGYFHEALDRARRDIVYHTEEIEKERQRVQSRNEWVRLLRESLKEAKV